MKKNERNTFLHACLLGFVFLPLVLHAHSITRQTEWEQGYCAMCITDLLYAGHHIYFLRLAEKKTKLNWLVVWLFGLLFV